jgi:DMSO/TMAO reductase YedYZ molybdopterin-dependent catalytic subunit
MPPSRRASFGRRRPMAHRSRVRPGQCVTAGFTVLSVGPTSHISQNEWSFTIDGAADRTLVVVVDAFITLRAETFTVDSHCVTTWSKLNTTWRAPRWRLLTNVHTEAEHVDTNGDLSTIPIGQLPVALVAD